MPPFITQSLPDSSLPESTFECPDDEEEDDEEEEEEDDDDEDEDELEDL